MKITQRLFSFPTLQSVFALTLTGGCFAYTIPTEPLAASFPTNARMQQVTQQEEEPDQPAPPPRPGRKKFNDGPKRGRVVPAAPAAPDVNTAPQNRSVSRWVNNGNTTTSLKTDDREIKVEQSDQGIFIREVRTFGRADLPMLEEKNPELADAIKAFPESTDGAELDVAVTSTKRYEAVDLQQLEKQKPEAFALYQEVMKAFEEQGGIANGFPMGPGFNGPGFNNQAFQFGGNLEFGPEMEARMQQNMQEMEQRMQQQLQQFQRMQQNMQGGNFQFNLGN